MPDGAVLAVLDVYYATMGGGPAIALIVIGVILSLLKRMTGVVARRAASGPRQVAGITLGRVMISRNRSNKILYGGPATAATRRAWRRAASGR